MGFIAIVGSGALGGAVAHALAVRDRVVDVRLIDPVGHVARGKALDILQSSPVDNFTVKVSGAEAVDAAVGADVIVVADAADSHVEHGGEPGLALLRSLLRAGHRGPIVCAGAAQRELIASAITELYVDRAQILGSAPFALESALRALAGLAIDRSGVEIALRVVGVPPRAATVAWEEASACGQPLTAELPAHIIAGLAARIPGLWPPGPYVLAAAAARIVEAIACGSRRRFSCFVALDAGPRRVAVSAMPVELGARGVERVIEPVLTRQERTALDTAIDRN
jgi:malate dehydrogenase